MENYLLFVLIASATIASPGPGVVLSISNSLKYGFWGSIAGILAVASGMFFIAILSATGLAAILATSALAFTVLKYIGATYLIYLGIKLWLSSSKMDLNYKKNSKSNKEKFTEGLFITLLNPKPIFFFMALFPQFINPSKNYLIQFLLLAMTFSTLVIIIHCTYAFFAKTARSKLSTPKGSQLLSKISGSFYVFFGIGLATTNK